MSFGEAVSTCFKKFAVFEGRAPRSEFWWFFLFDLLTAIILLVGGAALLGDAIASLELSNEDLKNLAYGLVSLPLLLPRFAVGARRLHDSGKSGWLQLLIFIPYVGVFILVILCALKGDEGPNHFGEDPLSGGHFSGNRIVDDIKQPQEAKTIVHCPKCAQKIAVSPGQRLQLTCPACQTQFEVLP